MADPLARLRRGGTNIVLGRVGLDLYPEPPGTAIEDAETFRTALGGSSANIAVAIRKAGGRAALVTRVSDDPFGRGALAGLDRYGIDRTHVRVHGEGSRLSLAFAESRVEGFQTVLYRNNAADLALSVGDVADLPYANAAALVLTGTVLAAEPSRGAGFAAIERAAEAGVPIVLDLDYRPYSWASPEDARDTLSRAARAATMIVGNDEEWDWMSGGDGLALARETGRRAVAIHKRGPRGSLTIAPGASSEPGLEFETAPFRVAALKPIGAGDAFLGTLLAHVQRGDALEEAVRRGAAAAAITVSRFGCAPAIPLPDEIDEFLKDR